MKPNLLEILHQQQVGTENEVELRHAANGVGVMIARANGAPSVISVVRAVKPAAVLLDLDLPAEAAWVTADALLQEDDCPPVLLLTGRSEQFDVRTAVRAGSLVDKSAGPARLLEVARETVAAPNSWPAERNAIQRVVLRWLKPCGWSVPVTPAFRFWGINE